jgi:hypothetical protein
MDSILSVLAMVGSLLILGWLVGSGKESATLAAGEDSSPERQHAKPGPFEER